MAYRDSSTFSRRDWENHRHRGMLLELDEAGKRVRIAHGCPHGTDKVYATWFRLSPDMELALEVNFRKDTVVAFDVTRRLFAKNFALGLPSKAQHYKDAEESGLFQHRTSETDAPLTEKVMERVHERVTDIQELKENPQPGWTQGHMCSTEPCVQSIPKEDFKEHRHLVIIDDPQTGQPATYEVGWDLAAPEPGAEVPPTVEENVREAFKQQVAADLASEPITVIDSLSNVVAPGFPVLHLDGGLRPGELNSIIGECDPRNAREPVYMDHSYETPATQKFDRLGGRENQPNETGRRLPCEPNRIEMNKHGGHTHYSPDGKRLAGYNAAGKPIDPWGNEIELPPLPEGTTEVDYSTIEPAIPGQNDWWNQTLASRVNDSHVIIPTRKHKEDVPVGVRLAQMYDSSPPEPDWQSLEPSATIGNELKPAVTVSAEGLSRLVQQYCQPRPLPKKQAWNPPKARRQSKKMKKNRR